MTATDLERQLAMYHHRRLRFECRALENSRQLENIKGDFHKQYGPYSADWEAVYESCDSYHEYVDSYLEVRDQIVCQLGQFLSLASRANTKYSLKRAHREFSYLLADSEVSDGEMLAELDEHLETTKAMTRLLTILEEDDLSTEL